MAANDGSGAEDVDSNIKNVRRRLAALDPPQECIASVCDVGCRLDLA